MTSWNEIKILYEFQMKLKVVVTNYKSTSASEQLSLATEFLSIHFRVEQYQFFPF